MQIVTLIRHESDTKSMKMTFYVTEARAQGDPEALVLPFRLKSLCQLAADH